MSSLLWRRGVWGVAAAVVFGLFAACGPEGLMDDIGKVIPASLGLTQEPNSLVPNGATSTATPILGTQEVIKGNLWPNGDIDFYRFSATAGDRLYAAMNTQGSAGNSTDSQLTLLDVDGTTAIEFDDDNGSFAALSSSIAGATLPTTGTYFLKVSDFTAGTTSERGYELHFRLQSGAPTPEVEANDTPATGPQRFLGLG